MSTNQSRKKQKKIDAKMPMGKSASQAKVIRQEMGLDILKTNALHVEYLTRCILKTLITKQDKLATTHVHALGQNVRNVCARLEIACATNDEG